MPSASDEETLRLAHNELEAEGTQEFLLHNFAGSSTEFSDYLGVLERFAEARNLPEGMVQDTFLVALVAGEIVGRISIRHSLNDFLFNFGGHIGYIVRPAYRRMGYASEMLRQALLLSKQIGLERVLITCNDENIGSIKVIEKHGGVLENKVASDGQLMRRYWIDNT